mgnify:CR=1 FL=1|jgi:hypothetical protein
MQKVNIPEGICGDYKIERFTTDRTDWSALKSGRSVPIGESFTRLMHKGNLIMSDTPAEQRDHMLPVFRAGGSCLINGLGIGMVLHNILLKDCVTDVTVIEISEEVIKLVGPSYTSDPRVTIIQANALEYKPPKGKRYRMVWHDIWPSICEANLPSMMTLHRKYGRRCDWQGSWARELIRR